MALVLETLGGDESLDLGGLGVGGLALALGLDLAANDVLADLFDGEVSRHVGDTNLAKKKLVAMLVALWSVPWMEQASCPFLSSHFPFLFSFWCLPRERQKRDMFESNQK